MIPAATSRKQVFIGSNSTGPFTVSFRVFDVGDLVVTKYAVDGTPTSLNAPADYAAALIADGLTGLTLTLTVALMTGEKLLIDGSTPISQDTSFANQGEYYGSTHEDSYDKLTMLLQEFYAILSRAPVIPSIDDGAGVVLPVASLRANKALIFDSAGNFTISTDDFNNISGYVTTVIAAAATATTQAGSATTANTSALAAAANGLTYQNNAAASALAAAASAASFSLTGTSTTSLTIGTGSATFTTQSGRGWTLGQRLRAANNDGSIVMEGPVTAYSGTSLTLNVDYTLNTGTNAVWNINITGARGAAGSSGSGSGNMVSTNNLSDVASASTSRTNLGLAIGTNVQAWSAKLDALSSLTWGANLLPYFTSTSALATTATTSFGRSVLNAANAAALAALAGLGSAAVLSAGTSDGNVVVVQTGGKLPALSGENLTNLPGTIFSKKYSSSEQTITQSGTLTLAHGLSGQPFDVFVILVNISADQGYSPGEIIYRPTLVDPAGRGASIMADATSIYVQYGSVSGGSNSNVFSYLNGSSGNYTSLNNAKWNAIFCAWL